MKMEFWKIFTLFFVFSVLFESFALNLYHVSTPKRSYFPQRKEKESC